MALSGEEKAAQIKKFAKSPNDTGSAHVQIAVITSRLGYLQDHFSAHPSDKHSRRGLMKLVGRRRRLLDYLKRENIEEYRTLIDQLGIRK